MTDLDDTLPLPNSLSCGYINCNEWGSKPICNNNYEDCIKYQRWRKACVLLREKESRRKNIEDKTNGNNN